MWPMTRLSFNFCVRRWFLPSCLYVPQYSAWQGRFCVASESPGSLRKNPFSCINSPYAKIGSSLEYSATDTLISCRNTTITNYAAKAVNLANSSMEMTNKLPLAQEARPRNSQMKNVLLDSAKKKKFKKQESKLVTHGQQTGWLVQPTKWWST